MKRITTRDLPTKAICKFADCIYKKRGACDDVRINRQNGDAACAKISNKILLEYLDPIRRASVAAEAEREK